jgi:hypothetical protein
LGKKQVCNKSDILPGELGKKNHSYKDIWKIKTKIIEICHKFKISSIKFNEGVGYIGFHKALW